MYRFLSSTHRLPDQGSRRSRTQARRLLLESLEDRSLLAGDVVIDWNNVLLQTIRDERTNPPVATRILAAMHTAIYDAVNSIDRTHEKYAVQLVVHPGTSREAAVAAAAHTVLSEMYKGSVNFDSKLKDTFDNALDASLAEVPNGAAENRGVKLGIDVANQILALRENDGWNEPIVYTPGSDPGDWRPTPAAFAPPLLPHWGEVEPWAMNSPTQFALNNIPDLDSPEYAAALNEVKAFGAKTGSSRTEDQTQIGLFWNNGAGTATPPGHLNMMAQLAAQSEGNTLSENARMFALLNLSQADAAIMCWNIKFSTDFWRPISAIRLADTDPNDATVADPAWESLIPTPPFPTYTSGHSTFSGAAAAVLADFFGTDNISFRLESEAGPDVHDRFFTSFSQAAIESRDSRLYGGIHFRFDNEDGYDSGFDLGQFVADNFLQPQLQQPTVDVVDGVMTILGTQGRDVIAVLRAGSRLRVLVGGQNFGTFGGVESIQVFGEGGNDIIQLAAKVQQDARLHGGDGNDLLMGGSGDDALFGNAGIDKLFGRSGNDLLDGGDDNDYLSGGKGNDQLIGGGGKDLLVGGSGVDELFDSHAQRRRRR